VPSFDALVGGAILPPPPNAGPAPAAKPIRTAARLLTSAAALRPPYPASKLASGEEALLRLKLTIDAVGRVVAVDAVGPADRAFLEAARRHLLAHWRYKPASESGQAAPSTVIVALRFQLDD
jgi:protein TonB